MMSDLDYILVQSEIVGTLTILNRYIRRVHPHRDLTTIHADSHFSVTETLVRVPIRFVPFMSAPIKILQAKNSISEAFKVTHYGYIYRLDFEEVILSK